MGSLGYKEGENCRDSGVEMEKGGVGRGERNLTWVIWGTMYHYGQCTVVQVDFYIAVIGEMVTLYNTSVHSVYSVNNVHCTAYTMNSTQRTQRKRIKTEHSMNSDNNSQ